MQVAHTSAALPQESAHATYRTIFEVADLHLIPVNADVHSVHGPDGAHVGNLKRIGTVWKFKAVGYDANGGVEPGGGPLTGQHNGVFETPDAQVLSARLGCCL